MTKHNLLVFGLGYSGSAIASLACARGIAVIATCRGAAGTPCIPGVRAIAFDAAADAIRRATLIVSTAGPGEAGDPVLREFGAEIAAAPHLRWAGYMSTIGVYGDRGGAWVDEDTPVAPGSTRSQRRVEAEQAWAALGARMRVDLFRTGGIYGPGRSALDAIRAGRARRIVRPGHTFSRIHRDDIAAAIVAAALQEWSPGARVLHLADDEPAENAAVVSEAAALLGAPLPPLVDYAGAMAAMNPLGRSFWAESRKVASAKTQAALGLRWRYPTYREGLRAIVAEERRDGAHEE
ncbi:MAG TPA: SDR family NAD(P)-dependent oxidoreductase [Acetobacteraceae bacterium]|jgi:nucleoside-diphosphate-sugar epimerase|nr:SDR family NAD(P)-dependent oxidoreductase [Acetobacteraceae bacterium]